MVSPGTNGKRRGYNRAAEVCVEVSQPAARAQRGEHDEEKHADRNLKPESQINCYISIYRGVFVSSSVCVSEDIVVDGGGGGGELRIEITRVT